MRRLFAVAPTLVALVACGGGDPVDIGDDRVIRTGEKLSDYAAVWEGYAEANDFDSGSDRIRLTLDESGEGTFEVGDAPPIPPPTNFDVGYPEGENISPAGVHVFLRSGFAYSVVDASVESRRLRLSINPYELYAEWCRMQTPHLFEGESYYCAPVHSGGQRDGQCFVDDPETGEPIYIDCGKLGLCFPGGVCECTADTCDAISDRQTVHLDAALESDGDELEGTLTVGGNVQVRMTRQ